MSDPRYVEPRVIGDNVFCPCGSLMEAIEHTDLETGGVWIWWRCHANWDHVTRTVPASPEVVTWR